MRLTLPLVMVGLIATGLWVFLLLEANPETRMIGNFILSCCMVWATFLHAVIARMAQADHEVIRSKMTRRGQRTSLARLWAIWLNPASLILIICLIGLIGLVLDAGPEYPRVARVCPQKPVYLPCGWPGYPYPRNQICYQQFSMTGEGSTRTPPKGGRVCLSSQVAPDRNRTNPAFEFDWGMSACG